MAQQVNTAWLGEHVLNLLENIPLLGETTLPHRAIIAQLGARLIMLEELPLLLGETIQVSMVIILLLGE